MWFGSSGTWPGGTTSAQETPNTRTTPSSAASGAGTDRSRYRTAPGFRTPVTSMDASPGAAGGADGTGGPARPGGAFYGAGRAHQGKSPTRAGAPAERA